MLTIVSGIMLLACLNSCKQNHLTYNTSGTVNMYDYMVQNPDQFSLFKSIVDKAGYASFLNTYGTYTLFLPNNDAVNKYLKANSKTSVDVIDAATAKGLVSIALIADTLSSQYFSDGKLRTPTTIGQYLVTGTTTINGVANITINKQANLVTANIKVGNGIIHIIDNVLVPASLTLAQTIEQSGKYTIFTAILKATGLYDTLNVAAVNNTNINRKYLTVIGETDSTLKASGFADYNAMKTKYSTKGDPTNHADSLWLYAAYHIWPELSYLSDIAITTSHSTLAPLEITTSQLLGQDVLINNDTFNGILELGQRLYRPGSDVSASNGVLHSAWGYAAVIGGVSYTSVGNYSIKIRFPSPVYFDVAVQPEILRTPGLYRGNNVNLNFAVGTIAGILEKATGSSLYVNYQSLTVPIPAASTNYYYNNDYILGGLRWRTGSNGTQSMEFTTPVIVKGQYKVWVDYFRQSASQVVPAYFDNVSMANTFNDGDALNAAETDSQAESRGFKSYSDAPVNTTANPYYGFVGRLLGIVTIKTTDHHKIRFESTAGSGDAKTFIIDVVEFRPVTMDQVHPRLGRAGNLVP